MTTLLHGSARREAPGGKQRASRQRVFGARLTAIVVVFALLVFGVVYFVRGVQTTACDNVHFESAGQPVTPSQSPPAIGEPGIVRDLHSFLRGPTPAVFCNDFPDPFVLRVGDSYYAYATSNDGFNIPVLATHGLFGAGGRHDALPQLPAWSSPGWAWAPSVLPVGSTYVMYYATRDDAAGEQCLSSAAATDPNGPFVDTSAGPLVCPPGGAIDPSPYVDPSGQAFLVWKDEGSGTIVGQQLAPDGRSLVGSSARLIGADQAWDGGVVEGPSLVAASGRLFLFYSGNQWQTTNYAVGYAVCTSPLGPCVKTPGPWLASGANVEGPGGPEFFTDPSGQTWMAVAAWIDGEVGYPQGARNLFVLRVSFPNGVPTAS